jgi:hypothetical protein
MPTLDSPSELATVLKWVYEHRDAAAYAALFTSDFIFSFEPLSGDSTPRPSPWSPWDYEDELIASNNLFVTGNSQIGPAQRITLEMAYVRPVSPDPRSGKDPRFHELVDLDVILTVYCQTGVFRIFSNARFFMARGDSASVPPGLDVPADSTRWYVERWEEGVTPFGGLRTRTVERTLPGANFTWGTLKELYRS